MASRVEPATSTVDAVRAGRGSDPVHHISSVAVAILVLTAFIHVAMHIELLRVSSPHIRPDHRPSLLDRIQKGSSARTLSSVSTQCRPGGDRCTMLQKSARQERVPWVA